ncbi:MCE family protein [Aeromicrobium sp. CTD01-1L150]|uniref:MCE family protein n=1 Tax=Aeromicrobium sp. CTD01-1L150 TaxID=3341830 RepID=UPI0035BF3D11
MITRFTKIQLVIFAIITVLGTAFVGGRYAEVDRIFIDRTYPVTAKFEDSGGIFAGAQVTYRGIEVGRVGELEFTRDGVDVVLDIEKDAPDISADAEAHVANKSAIGEQFVDLQPQSNQAPFLQAGSTIETTKTAIPIDTTTLLVNVNSLVKSIDTDNLSTLVAELGAAFEGTGRDLTRIVDTTTEFINEADANIDVTRDLIHNSQGVLQTQIDKQGQLATFSENLALFSDTLVESDADVRRLLDEGTPAARETRELVDENAEDLRSIFRDLRVATEPVARNNKGLQVLSILYPYLLEGSFSVAGPSERVKGEYDATFGLVLSSPVGDGKVEVCEDGHRERMDPDQLGERSTADPDAQNRTPRGFDLDVNCTDPEKMPTRTTLDSEDINRNRTSVAPGEGADGVADDSVTGKGALSWLLLEPASN